MALTATLPTRRGIDSEDHSSDESEPKPLSQRERILRISAVIRRAELRLRRRYPILNQQDLLGAVIFIASAAGFLISSTLYLQGIVPAWACVLLNAMFASLLHELEHDLIHNLYFRTRPLVQHFLMLGVWVFRGNTINPWYRRHLHLLHHRESGRDTDLEERLLGNGLRYGIRRCFTTLDAFVGSLLRWKELTQIPACKPGGLLRAGFPLMVMFCVCWYAWLVLHGLSWTHTWLGTSWIPPAWLSSVTTMLNTVVVIYVLPNVIRQGCLNFISSTMHYYGDVGDTIEQTQVLNAWYFWPFQLFCFNFGSTHGIHHFVVSQPFYLRQMVARPAHRAMRRYGVRFNDLGTFARANRRD